MRWVTNNHNDRFTLIWNGETYVLEPKKSIPIPKEAVNAFLPQPEKLEEWISGSHDVVSSTRAILEIILNRWDNGVNKVPIKFTGVKETDVKNILDFFDKFEIKDNVEEKKEK